MVGTIHLVGLASSGCIKSNNILTFLLRDNNVAKNHEDWTAVAMAVFCNLFIGMEPFGVFKFLKKPDSATLEFVLFQMDRTSSSYTQLEMKNTSLYTCMCSTVIVA